MLRPHLCIGSLLLLLLLGVPDAVGQKVPGFCIQDLVRGPIFPPHPIGCEVIDCCPGCPARGTLACVIDPRGDAVVAMTLEFEGLSREMARSLRIAGAAS